MSDNEYSVDDWAASLETIYEDMKFATYAANIKDYKSAAILMDEIMQMASNAKVSFMQCQEKEKCKDAVRLVVTK